MLKNGTLCYRIVDIENKCFCQTHPNAMILHKILIELLFKKISIAKEQ